MLRPSLAVMTALISVFCIGLPVSSQSVYTVQNEAIRARTCKTDSESLERTMAALERDAATQDEDVSLALCHEGDYLVTEGNFDDAESFFLRALQFHFPPEDAGDWVASAFLGLGRVFFHKEYYADARVCLSEAIKQASRNEVINEANALLKKLPGEPKSTTSIAPANAREQVTVYSRSLLMTANSVSDVVMRADFAVGETYYEAREYALAFHFLNEGRDIWTFSHCECNNKGSNETAG